MSRPWLALLVVLHAGVLARGDDSPYVLVLGTAQDAGYPQAGCQKPCCKNHSFKRTPRLYATSIAIVDPESKQRWLIDCTPDFREQLQLLDRATPEFGGRQLNGILLTHAHIGHYTGLIHFGREAMGTGGVPVYAMPRMRTFLEKNGPWSQLVTLKNIELRPLSDGAPVKLNERISVTPLAVPHRDEFSETVGFVIRGPRQRILVLPDIDKWDKWKTPIEQVLADVDVAYLDGTFYANGEIRGRDMSLIPHPFIEESLARFTKLPAAERTKVRFIHMNHTNPAISRVSAAHRIVLSAGCHVALQGERKEL